MIETLAKERLRRSLQVARDALVWKLEDLSEYDTRRPLTATGTNLLGLVKHAATWEARYLGDVFDRPFPDPLPRWEDSDGEDLWATAAESRQDIVGFYRRAWEHADATIDALALDAPGYVPWWRSKVTRFDVVVHVVVDTTRHAGHADILREQIDGHTGVAAEWAESIDAAARDVHRARVEQAARSAHRTLPD